MNEPVAWMVDGVLFTSLGAALNISFDIKQPCIPLYTHPVKELTGEEIRKIALECDAYENDGGLITDDICIGKFARAILRKAQEK